MWRNAKKKKTKAVFIYQILGESSEVEGFLSRRRRVSKDLEPFVELAPSLSRFPFHSRVCFGLFPSFHFRFRVKSKSAQCPFFGSPGMPYSFRSGIQSGLSSCRERTCENRGKNGPQNKQNSFIKHRRPSSYTFQSL